MAICACIKEIYIEVESWLCGLEAPAQRMERPLVEGSLEQAGPTLMQSSSEIRCAQCTGPLPAGRTRFCSGCVSGPIQAGAGTRNLWPPASVPLCRVWTCIAFRAPPKRASAESRLPSSALPIAGSSLPRNLFSFFSAAVPRFGLTLSG